MVNDNVNIFQNKFLAKRENARQSSHDIIKEKIRNIGAKGDKGDRGNKGDKGDKGDKGADGKRGLQGGQGDQGIRGGDGRIGGKGDQGVDGSDGDDAVFIEDINVTDDNELIIIMSDGSKMSAGFIKVKERQNIPEFSGIHLQRIRHLTDLIDVTITDVQDEDVIVFDSDTQMWINRNSTISKIVTEITNYTLLDNDDIVIFNITSASIATLSDPTLNVGKTYRIVNKYTSTDNLTFSRNINGDSGFVVMPATTVNIVSDGVEYLVHE